MFKKVMIFGTFDGLHAGHVFFINEAMKHGDSLTVSIARDSVVQKLKNKIAKKSELERLSAVKSMFPNAVVILGDIEVGAWENIKEHTPETIVLGHDQHNLKNSLLESRGKLPFIKEIITIEKYENT